MLLVAAGDAHGRLDQLYADVLAFERALGRSFVHVLHVGDLGVAEILPGLRYLANGNSVRLSEIASSQPCKPAEVRVGGVGGCFGPSSFERPARELRGGGARRHYAREELDRLCGVGPLDVVLFHDAPLGIEFVKRMVSGTERRYASQAEGLTEVLRRVRPKLCFFGHHHAAIDVVIEGVRCIGLNAVGYPGNLVAFDLEQGTLVSWSGGELASLQARRPAAFDES